MLNQKMRTIKSSTDRWLLTYADMMNLLLIFFIVLYSMSQIDQAKYEALSQALRQAFQSEQMGKDSEESTKSIIQAPGKNGLLEGGSTFYPAELESEKKAMEIVIEKIEAMIEASGLVGQVNVTKQERGIQISIPSQLLFQVGSDVLEPTHQEKLMQIGSILQSEALIKNQIRIEGHTDSDPINTPRFASNWELSAARAVSVLRFLIEKNRLASNRIAATGYGEMWPLQPNTSAENKSKNRRVDIVILRSLYENIVPAKP